MHVFHCVFAEIINNYYVKYDLFFSEGVVWVTTYKVKIKLTKISFNCTYAMSTHPFLMTYFSNINGLL